ncbi:hypothetical protein EJB05_37197, partial [Eragrostis curvula]
MSSSVPTPEWLPEGGPPKRRKVTTKASTESSNNIVPFQDEGTALSMTYPPRFALKHHQISEPATKKKAKRAKSNSTRTIKPKSGSGSNQLEVHGDQAQEVAFATTIKATGKWHKRNGSKVLLGDVAKLTVLEQELNALQWQRRHKKFDEWQLKKFNF